jgi:hypothetical protein
MFDALHRSRWGKTVNLQMGPSHCAVRNAFVRAMDEGESRNFLTVRLKNGVNGRALKPTTMNGINA